MCNPQYLSSWSWCALVFINSCWSDCVQNSAKIIRSSVFGFDPNNKVRENFRFPQNSLVITSIDIQSVEPVDQRTRDSLQKSVQLAIEITTNSQEAAARSASCLRIITTPLPMPHLCHSDYTAQVWTQNEKVWTQWNLNRLKVSLVEFMSLVFAWMPGELLQATQVFVLFVWCLLNAN